MKIKINQLQEGDVFKHPSFSFHLTCSDAFEPTVEIQTTNMHPKTGEHIFFIGKQLEDNVTLISGRNPMYGKKCHPLFMPKEKTININ